MRRIVYVMITGLLLSACTRDTNPIMSPADPAGTPAAVSLAKGMGANTVLDFEDLLLLDSRDLNKILDISKKYSFQMANELYDLYPGVVFSTGLKLGYIYYPDPKRPGGQLYLYAPGNEECSITFNQPVYFTSVAARVDNKMISREEILTKIVYLNVTGSSGKGKGTSEYRGVVNAYLTDQLLGFNNKITLATFRLEGKAGMLVLDNLVFGHNQGDLGRTINTKMGFEELLENKDIYNALVAGKKLGIQYLNAKLDLYPGIEFSKDFMLGYDADANPGLGGQVYLYCLVGRPAFIRFLNGNVYFKSVYARILDPKYKQPITLQLRGYGDDKQRWVADVTVLDGDLVKDLPQFDGEVNLIYFYTKGSAKHFVLDDFKFKE